MFLTLSHSEANMTLFILLYVAPMQRLSLTRAMCSTRSMGSWSIIEQESLKQANHPLRRLVHLVMQILFARYPQTALYTHPEDTEEDETEEPEFVPLPPPPKA